MWPVSSLFHDKLRRSRFIPSAEFAFGIHGNSQYVVQVRFWCRWKRPSLGWINHTNQADVKPDSTCSISWSWLSNRLRCSFCLFGMKSCTGPQWLFLDKIRHHWNKQIRPIREIAETTVQFWTKLVPSFSQVQKELYTFYSITGLLDFSDCLKSGSPNAQIPHWRCLASHLLLLLLLVYGSFWLQLCIH